MKTMDTDTSKRAWLTLAGAKAATGLWYGDQTTLAQKTIAFVIFFTFEIVFNVVLDF